MKTVHSERGAKNAHASVYVLYVCVVLPLWGHRGGSNIHHKKKSIFSRCLPGKLPRGVKHATLNQQRPHTYIYKYANTEK